jgi:adenylosuccinate lyase
MIKRYSTPLSEIWTEAARIKRWLLIEAIVAEVEERLGIVPKGTKDGLKGMKISPERIVEIEKEVGHDIIAFLLAIKEKKKRYADFVHYGLTSYDLVDTSLSLALKESGNLILKSLKELAQILRRQAIRYRRQPIMGRTHGMFAEPTLLGLKFLSFYEETRRNIKRLKLAIDEISYGKVSGAVGTYSQLLPKVERMVLKRLGLRPEPVSTQIIPRDRHGFFLSTLTLIAAGLERITLEIRLLSRSDVGELREPFGRKQRGSSAMPHKKNPILSERINGLARVIRGYLITALENISLWHERDISHSSAERIIFPDATILCHYMINLTIRIIKGLKVERDRIDENLKRSNEIYFSQRLMLALIKKGMDKDWIYEKIQNLSFKALEKKRGLRYLVERDEDLATIFSKVEIDQIFSFQELLRNTDIIYKRSLDSSPE